MLFTGYHFGDICLELTGLYRNAKTAGMEDDLHLDGDRYEWLLTIFYIPYIVFEFLAMMWKIIPPNIWAATTVTG